MKAFMMAWHIKNDYTNEGKNRILKYGLRFHEKTNNNINQGADK